MDPVKRATTWRKSSYSGANGGNCVELAALAEGGLATRDSKDPRGPRLCLAPAEAADLFEAIKRGDLDLR
ncbi:DUF397 domain-containing protein [Actinomadura sediminis]|uniref:DUF397 domain-containing protein n=1 Tax=Actinomadura sediminis TaxID=1038904 RepID=A0ABW3EQL6_9ACTN